MEQAPQDASADGVPPSPQLADLQKDRFEVAKAMHGACGDALEAEEDRGRALDQKLNQTASFAGVVLALVGATGGALAASPDVLSLPWRIATGSTLVLASLLLLAGIIWSFLAVAPKRYLGIEEAAVTDMTRPAALTMTPVDTYVFLAATRRTIFHRARGVNDKKAVAAARATALVMSGMTFVVITLLLRTIENAT